MKAQINNQDLSAVKKSRISQQDVPAHSLEQALRVPRAILEELAGGPSKPLHVAQAMGIQPTSGGFRTITGAATAYGLTNGAYNAQTIEVTDLGRQILRPTAEGKDKEGKLSALLNPRCLGDFLRKYDGHALPKEEIAVNVLEELGVPRDRGDEVFALIVEGAKAVGAVTIISDRQYVDLSLASAGSSEEQSSEISEPDETKHDSGPTESIHQSSQLSQKALGKGIFIAHGRNKDVVEQLTRILNGFKVPFKIAEDEPNLGRPIGKKVRQIMSDCNCAIVVLTPDEEFINTKGEKVCRPTENAFHELGAASFLYDDRIVILKHERVTMPSNVNEIGRISFDDSGLDSKAMDILKELIGFGLLQVSTT